MHLNCLVCSRSLGPHLSCLWVMYAYDTNIQSRMPVADPKSFGLADPVRNIAVAEGRSARIDLV